MGRADDIAPSLVGRTLAGRYRLTDLMHRGLDAVYRAEDPQQPGRAVVLKVMVDCPNPSGDLRRSYDREVRRLSRLYSDHNVHVTDFGVDEEGGWPFLVMDLVEGERLDLRLKRGPLTPHEAFQVAQGIGAALVEAHAALVVHRDVKPQNIMVRVEGDTLAATLFDYELALEGNRAKARTELIHADPHHMAPEQSAGEEAGRETDVYLFGATIFEMLAGRPPFTGDTPKQVLLRQLRDKPPALPGPETPLHQGLNALLRELLDKAPKARPREIGAVVQRLQSLVYKSGDAAYRLLDPPEIEATETPPPPTPPPSAPTPPRQAGLLIGLGAALAAAGAAAWWFLGR